MSFDLLELNPPICGLDISDREIKIFGFVRKGRKTRISIMKKHSLEQGIVKRGEVRDVKRLSEGLRKLVFSGEKAPARHVVAALPEEKSFLRVIRMPRMDKTEMQQAVRYEAENYIPFSLDKVYLDFHALPFSDEKERTIEVLLVAIPKKIVNPYIEAINDAGLTPIALETESQAIARALIPESQEIKAPIFLADIGSSRTSTGIYWGSSLRLTSFIPISSRKFSQSIAYKMNKEWAEAEKLKKIYGLLKSGETGEKVFNALEKDIDELANQIKRQIDYYQSSEDGAEIPNDKEIKSLILSGGGSNLKGLDQVLLKKLGIPVREGDPLINLSPITEKPGQFSAKELMSYTVAIGLSLKKAET
jgi:type IV pilus assembly protein PilM